MAWHLFLRSPPQPATSTATSIYALKDSDLSKKLIETGKEHPYTKCKSQQIRGRHLPEYLPAAETFSKLKTYPKKEGAIAGNEFVEVLVKDAPCW